ncbi:MAG: MBL fold metallo-hydrolase [Gammaproteobacteria bacterium]|nr:MBL fold metallo-hydrolase [Gammaproteobacteria bacterium]
MAAMTIRYEFEQRPDYGTTLPVADDILWLRMPLPFSLEHINLWVLRDADHWVVVDTGVGDDRTIELWKQVFMGAMQNRPASHIVATHLHPDHIGCAGFLARHFDVDLWMAREEYMLCRVLVADTNKPAPEEGINFYKGAGFTDEQLKGYRRAFGFFGKFVTPLPESYKRLRDGDRLPLQDRTWEVISGGGHSPEHCCFYDREQKLLIAGDQLLPTISPNVSVWPTEPLANPLRDWFTGLNKLKSSIDEETLVLPSHGKPFRGAWPRIDALIQEHEERLDVLRDICRQPHRTVDVFPALYRSKINDGNLVLATGEALAHLHYLLGTGELTSYEEDSQLWYTTT